jgi:hypothetical protein
MTDGCEHLLYNSSWKFHQLAARQPLSGQPVWLGCPSKLVLIRNTNTGTKTSFGTIRNKTFVSVVSLLYRTESFDVSIEPKQTVDQPKQFDREHILQFFTENLGFFRFFKVFFWFFRVFRFFSVCL